MTITCTPKRDPTIPIYPEVKITFDFTWRFLTSESYIPIHDELGVPYLTMCQATANGNAMPLVDAIAYVTKEMNIMALDFMGRVLTKHEIKYCIPA